MVEEVDGTVAAAVGLEAVVAGLVVEVDGTVDIEAPVVGCSPGAAEEVAPGAAEEVVDIGGEETNSPPPTIRLKATRSHRSRPK
jgi:hypothetical protein